MLSPSTCAYVPTASPADLHVPTYSAIAWFFAEWEALIYMASQWNRRQY